MCAAGMGKPVPGNKNLIVRFLRGVRRLRPPRPPLVNCWNLSIVLTGLQRAPIEPLESIKLKFMSAETGLLTALISIKRVGTSKHFR